MTKLRLSFLALLLLASCSAMWAYDVKVDGVYYNLNVETYEAEVTRNEEITYAGSIVIPEKITVNDVAYSVKSVGYQAFWNCFDLTSCTIPEGVVSIGNYAFAGCNNLNSITIPNSVKAIGELAFDRCSSLTSIIIPDGVTAIGRFAFSGCSGLSTIVIPSGVSSIEHYMFSGCSNLTSLVIPDNVKSIGAGVFDGCSSLTSITIPEGLTAIGDGAFAKCNSLTSISIPESVVSIGNYVFQDCIGLVSLTIPNGVTSIGGGTFRGCTGLTSAIIPEGVTSIGDEAFKECSSLTSITIPNSVTSIGTGAFEDCTGLETVSMSNSISTMENEVFRGCSSLSSICLPDGVTSIGEYAFLGCRGLTTIIIPKSVTSIGDYAFYECAELASIDIPEGVTSIGFATFYGCSSLVSITIPNSVTSIGSSAFQECSSLTSITIPDGVSSIGSSAFQGCTGLTSITIPEGLTLIENATFQRCSNLTSIIIPEGVISIEGNAFNGCNNLVSVDIPESVVSIGGYAFSCCCRLTSIVLPESLTSIGQYSFYHCCSLQSIRFGSIIPPAVEENSFNIFSYCPDALVICVPQDAAANYDVAPWNYYEIIEKGEDYAMWASSMKTRPTKPITLSIQLNNATAISDYQFDLCLPDGFSVAIDEDELKEIYLSTERTTERQHTYSYNMVSDSILRVISYSNSIATFSGNEGEVLTITLDVAEDVADGDYTLLMKNIEMTEPDGTAHKASDYACHVTVVSYTPGDVNDDGNFSVTDVRGIVNMVLAAQVPDDNLAADVNEDGVISVADVRGAVNLVLNPVSVATAKLAPKMRAAVSSNNLLYIEPFTIAPGEEKEVLVMLNNPGDAFSDIQFDLYLPEGIEVVKDEIGYFIDLGSRTTSRKHNLPEAALQTDGAVRVLCYTNKDYVFSSESGDVMVVTLKAADDLSAGVCNLELKNVELARPDMSSDRPQAYTASVLTGSVETRDITIQGYLSVEAMSELSTGLSAATEVASIDLSSAVYVDAEGTLTTGNPNALVMLADGMSIANSQNVLVDGVCENLSLSDALPFYASTNFTADNFTFERNFTEAKVASFVLPAGVPVSAVNGRVYKLTGVNGNVLKFSEVTNGMLEANMPYMVEVSAAGELLSGTLSEISITATPAEIVNVVENVQHVGTYQQQSVVSDALCTYYGFTGGEFVKANSGTLKPFRTMIAAGNASLTNKYLLDFGNGVTGLSGLGDEIAIGESYDLSGRKVINPVKGVYVINGKKVIIK